MIFLDQLINEVVNDKSILTLLFSGSLLISNPVSVACAEMLLHSCLRSIARCASSFSCRVLFFL